MILILGYLSAVIIGILLGLIGAGGSILTVPVLVYLLGVPPVLATGYSLFIVGFSALVGSAGYIKNDLVSYKAAISFGIPSIIGVYIARTIVVPYLPNELFYIGDFLLKKNSAIMVLFSVLMVYSAIFMIKNQAVIQLEGKKIKTGYVYTFIKGIVVGLLTGMVGAGGGFLIVPSLVLLANLPMKIAIGTSLLIIAVNSIFGFLSGMSYIGDIDWKFLLLFITFSISGIMLGGYLSKFVSGARLKPAFGGFILMMAGVIIFEELLKQ